MTYIRWKIVTITLYTDHWPKHPPLLSLVAPPLLFSIGWSMDYHILFAHLDPGPHRLLPEGIKRTASPKYTDRDHLKSSQHILTFWGGLHFNPLNVYKHGRRIFTCLFGTRVPYSTCWPLTYYVAEDVIELQIFLTHLLNAGMLGLCSAGDLPQLSMLGKQIPLGEFLKPFSSPTCFHFWFVLCW